MKTEFKNLPKSEIQITIEIPQEKLEIYETEAAKRISQQVDIPGFRPGQAPKAFVISRVGENAFFQEVLNVALPRTYFEAVKLNNLAVISRPEIKILSKSPLKYEARAALLPEIKLKGYEKMKISRKPVEISEKEIDDVISEMRKYKASYKPREQQVEKGDRVEIDFEGFDEEGKALPNTKSINYPLFVGKGSLVAGFEDQLVGMKKDEKKKFPLKFPKDFQNPQFKGKTVHFEVTMKRAFETILPEVDEAFMAEVVGAGKTAAQFREDLKKDMHIRKTAEERKQRENELLEKFLREAKMEVSPILVEEEIDYMIEDLKRELDYREVNFENYMKKIKEQGKDLRKEYTPEAEKRIRIRLVVNYLFKEMGVDVNEEEMNVVFSRFIERSPESDKSVLKQEFDQKKGIYLRLRNNLMLEKLFSKFLD